MRLRLAKQGQDVLDRWFARDPPEADRRLAIEVLRAIADRTWRDRRWYYHTEVTDDGDTVTIVQPRRGLYIAVQLWTDTDSVFDLRYIGS